MSARTILILPVYNESITILDVLAQSDPFVDQILVIDDGSRDSTRQLLANYAASHPKLFFVSHRTNRGVSGALLTGFLILQEGVQAGRINPLDIVITMDSDGQHDASDIPALTAPIRDESADLVIGERTFDMYPWFKKLGNWGLSRWASAWAGTPYRDAECGFRAMTMRVVMDILLFFNPTQYGFAQEMSVITARRGWRVQNDVPIHILRYRSGAKIKHGFNNAWSAVRAWHRVTYNRVVAHRGGWPEQIMPYDEATHVQHYR
ncbi:MAG: glycosyltransferase family 2 protein [Firmicutes bacterium]|nr:glycosyltransferase family 2 protein [Bacillota bacterium]